MKPIICHTTLDMPWTIGQAHGKFTLAGAVAQVCICMHMHAYDFSARAWGQGPCMAYRVSCMAHGHDVWPSGMSYVPWHVLCPVACPKLGQIGLDFSSTMSLKYDTCAEDQASRNSPGCYPLLPTETVSGTAAQMLRPHLQAPGARMM